MNKEVIRQLISALRTYEEFIKHEGLTFAIGSNAIAAGEAELAKPDPKNEPLTWILKYSDINPLQSDSLIKLVERSKHAHYIDVRLRINGKYEFYEADWLKHFHIVTPTQKDSQND